MNPVSVLRWNSDKSYLVGLGEKGVPTSRHYASTPLLRRPRNGPRSVRQGRDGQAADLRLGLRMHSIGPGDPVPNEAAGRPMMVQPFPRSVIDEGEYR